MQKLKIVIGDGGSTDGTPQVVEKWKDRGLNILYLYDENAPRGIGAGRNICIPHIEGKYVAWIDDDMLLPINFFSLLKFFDDANVGTVSSECVFESDSLWKRYYARRRVPSKPYEVEFAAAGDTIYRKEVMDKLGFNNTHLCEDVDYSIRMKKLGYKSIVDPSVTIYHMQIADFWRGYKLLFREASIIPLILNKHGLKWLKRYVTQAVGGTIWLISMFLFFFVWLNPFFALPFVVLTVLLLVWDAKNYNLSPKQIAYSPITLALALSYTLGFWKGILKLILIRSDKKAT